MYPLEVCRQCAARLQLRADPIFHRFHVVIGARLDALDRADVGACGILREGREPQAGIPGGRAQSGCGGAPPPRPPPRAPPPCPPPRPAPPPSTRSGPPRASPPTAR